MRCLLRLVLGILALHCLPCPAATFPTWKNLSSKRGELPVRQVVPLNKPAVSLATWMVMAPMTLFCPSGKSLLPWPGTAASQMAGIFT